MQGKARAVALRPREEVIGNREEVRRETRGFTLQLLVFFHQACC